LVPSFEKGSNGGPFIGVMALPPLNGKRTFWVDKRHKKRIKRQTKKKKEKASALESQNKMKRQMGMFERLPASCSACALPFPKTREAHMTWQVVVRNKEQQVRLFCPDCLSKARQLMEGESR